MLVFLCAVLLIVGLFFVVKPKYTVKGATYYCFCPYVTKTQTEAQTQAEEVRGKCGAGYVFEDGETYYVIASAYLNKDVAQKIASKNGGTVYEISLPTLSFYDKNQADEQSVAYTRIFGYASSLIMLSQDFDNARESVDSVLLEINRYEIAIKTEAHPIFSALTPKISGNCVVALKYYACDLIFSAYKYFRE